MSERMVGISAIPTRRLVMMALDTWKLETPHGCLLSKRIDHFEERKLIKIGIPCADSSDPVLAHENGRVRVVEQVAGEMRQLRNELSCDIGVSLGRDENGEAWRGEQRHDELPRRWRAPRPSHDPGVCCYAHKLVKDAPRGVPGIGSHALALEPVAAGAVKLGIGISGVNQYIGIDSEH
jgi:hypothetical protein